MLRTVTSHPHRLYRITRLRLKIVAGLAVFHHVVSSTISVGAISISNELLGQFHVCLRFLCLLPHELLDIIILCMFHVLDTLTVAAVQDTLQSFITG